MNRREEIRKGIEKYAESPATLWAYLHSQGMVIKKEGELPVLRLLSYYNKKTAAQAYRNAQNDMLKAGYTLTEPLIKETE